MNGPIGLLITGAPPYPSSAAIAISGVSTANAQWHDGITMVGGHIIDRYSINTNNLSQIDYEMSGAHQIGVDLANATFSQAAIRLGQGQALAWVPANGATGNNHSVAETATSLVLGNGAGPLLTVDDKAGLTLNGATVRRGVFAHSVDQIALAGYNEATFGPGVPITLTIDANATRSPTAESATNNISTQLATQWSVTLGIEAHSDCTNGGSYHADFSAHAYYTGNGSSSYALAASSYTTNYSSGDGAHWVPTFGVSTLAGYQGPLLTIVNNAGLVDPQVRCTADLRINENS